MSRGNPIMYLLSLRAPLGAWQSHKEEHSVSVNATGIYDKGIATSLALLAMTASIWLLLNVSMKKEGKTVNNSFLTNRTVQRIIMWIVALSFALFTFYQIILAIGIETTRFGRLIGIVFYLAITVAAFLHFSEKFSVWMAHSVLLVVALILLFITRLLSIGTVFGNLSFANPATVLNAAAYILSQLGTLVIVSGYIMLRADLTERQMKKLSIVLMSVAIALYVLCFIAECVMLIKYRFNIDLSLTFTLISRIWYFLGFAGTAFCFILPVPKRERKHRSGQFIYSDEEDGGDEIDLVI